MIRPPQTTRHTGTTRWAGASKGGTLTFRSGEYGSTAAPPLPLLNLPNGDPTVETGSSRRMSNPARAPGSPQGGAAEPNSAGRSVRRLQGGGADAGQPGTFKSMNATIGNPYHGRYYRRALGASLLQGDPVTPRTVIKGSRVPNPPAAAAAGGGGGADDAQTPRSPRTDRLSTKTTTHRKTAAAGVSSSGWPADAPAAPNDHASAVDSGATATATAVAAGATAAPAAKHAMVDDEDDAAEHAVPAAAPVQVPAPEAPATDTGEPTDGLTASPAKPGETTLVPSLPMTPGVAMKHFYDQLTPFEQAEILKYTEIYFVGRTRKKVRGIPHTEQNCGYDDERGDYKVVQGDHIAYRFEILGSLGHGSFGTVVKVFDHKKRRVMALKLIRNKKRFHQQALVEVRILEHVGQHDSNGESNVVHMEAYLYFREHLCIVFELLHINLYEMIKNNHFKGCSLSLVRKFAVRLLRSLVFLHGQNIIHCDLKPENILLVSPNHSDIRLIDLGSSCFETERMYSYIQSRFYRAPEVVLGQPYGIAIDLWSFGCILSELLTGVPIFPGENEVEQIQCMMEVLGVPPRRVLEGGTRRSKYFDEIGNPKITANSRGRVRMPGTRDLFSVTKCQDRQFVSFLSRCLEWDPQVRITASEATRHPFVADLYAAAYGTAVGSAGAAGTENLQDRTGGLFPQISGSGPR